MKGRLNVFQASMLRWRELWPYNAVHVVRIDLPLAPSELQHAVDDVLTAFGLAGFTLDLARRRFEYAGGAAHAPVRVLAPGPDPAETLRAEIEAQLNAPFPRTGRIDPFRFFALPRGTGFDLGLGYDHVVAAGDSIVVLMQAIVHRCHGGSDAIPAAAPPRYAPTYGRLLLRQLLPLLAGLPRIPVHIASLRRAFRPQYGHDRSPVMGFVDVRVDRHRAEALRQTARGWGVTVNDVLLAMLLQTMSPVAEARRGQSRRNEIAVASIVNIRADCGAPARDVFGQFLSSFHVSHTVPEGIGLEQLARDVAAVSARTKRAKLYLQTPLAMAAAGLAWRFMTPERRARFHERSYPVWAGISSLHVDALWTRTAGAAPVPEYVRAVPTGPFTPLVVAVTTAAGILELGISFRTAAFTRADIDRIAGVLVHRIDSLCR